MTSRVRDLNPGRVSVSSPRPENSTINVRREPRYPSDEEWYPSPTSTNTTQRPPPCPPRRRDFASPASVSSSIFQSGSDIDSGYASSESWRHSRSSIRDHDSSICAANGLGSERGSPWQDPSFADDEDHYGSAYTYGPTQLDEYFEDAFGSAGYRETPSPSPVNASDLGDVSGEASTPGETHNPSSSCSESNASEVTTGVPGPRLKESVRAAIRRPISSMLRRVSQLARDRSRRGKVCPWCSPEHRIPAQDLEAHIRKHLKDVGVEHACETCNITFVHGPDLHYHQVVIGHDAADVPCAHPSKPPQLLNWELAQLRCFMSFCDDVEETSAESEEWTLASSDRSIRVRDPGAWKSLPRLTATRSAPSAIEHSTRTIRRIYRSLRHFGSDVKPEAHGSTNGSSTSDDADVCEYLQRNQHQGTDAQSTYPGVSDNCNSYLSPPLSLYQTPGDVAQPSDVTRHQASTQERTHLDSPPLTLHEPGFEVQQMRLPDLTTTGFEHNYQSTAPYVAEAPDQLDSQSVESYNTGTCMPLLGVIELFPLPQGIASLVCMLTPPQSPPRLHQRPSSALSRIMSPTDRDLIDESNDPALSSMADATCSQPLQICSDKMSSHEDWPRKRRRLSTGTEEAGPSHVLDHAIPQDRGAPYGTIYLEADGRELKMLLPSPESISAPQSYPEGSRSPLRQTELVSTSIITPEQTMKHKLNTWFSDQETHGPAAGSIMEAHAETPSSAPAFTSSEFSTSPCKPLSERVNEFFNKFDEEIFQATPFDTDQETQDEVSLGIIFDLIGMEGPTTPHMILDLVHRSLSLSDIEIGKDELLSWVDASFDRTSLDLDRFKRLVHDTYDSIREVDDTMLEFEIFVANIGRIAGLEHHGNGEYSKAQGSRAPLISSFTGGNQSTPTRNPGGIGKQGTESTGNSGSRSKQQGNKRSLPDNGNEDTGPSKKLMVASDASDDAPAVAKLQLPCPLPSCCGKDFYISEVLLRLDLHASQQHRYATFICGDCYQSFPSKEARLSHSEGQLCEKSCVFPDCPRNNDSSGSSVESVLALRHKFGRGCPTAKGRSKDRWRFVFALCMSSCPAEHDNKGMEVPYPEISHGSRQEHVAPGATTTKPVRPEAQKLVHCQKLLREVNMEKETLQRENVQIAAERDMLKVHNANLSRWLQLCVTSPEYRIPPTVKTLIEHALRDAGEAAGPTPSTTQKEGDAQVQYVPNTPSSSRAGVATHCSSQQYGATLASSQSYTSNPTDSAGALASPSTMAGYSSNAYSEMMNNSSLHHYPDTHQFGTYLGMDPNDSNNFNDMNWQQEEGT